jgi:hypothetical protein
VVLAAYVGGFLWAVLRKVGCVSHSGVSVAVWAVLR